MNLFPDIDSYLDAIKEYRHSLAISLLVLCASISYFPHPMGIESITGTTAYAVGVIAVIIMFSISMGMIIVHDIWPWIKG